MGHKKKLDVVKSRQNISIRVKKDDDITFLQTSGVKDDYRKSIRDLLIVIHRI